MVDRGEAFCPGHVTGFFEICEDEDPLKMGSRGAGICLSRGVKTRVDVRPSRESRIHVSLSGHPGTAEVTTKAVELFLEAPAEVRLESDVQLPISQGFGMSGAGALSSLLALNEALGNPRKRDEVVALAHRAEVESRTGLGDVYPQAIGGMDIREKPGAPPHGLVHKLPLEAHVVLCVLGPPMATKVILSNEMVIRSVNGVGRRCVDRFLQRRDLTTFIQLAWLFARQTVLATSPVQAAVMRAELNGLASMSMLGNSIFAIGKADQLEADLKEHGDVYRVKVDNEGARTL